MKDVDSGWQLMYNNCLEALNKVAPLITMHNVKQQKCWTTPELMSLIRERDNKKLTADAVLNDKANVEYKELRNKFKRAVIKSKRAYVLSKLEDSTNSPKPYRKELNNLFNPSNSAKKAKLSNECDLQRNLLIAWRPTNIEEIEILIDNIDTHKSSVIENINSLLLKDCLLLTTDKVCTLFNKILLDGTFPLEKGLHYTNI